MNEARENLSTADIASDQTPREGSSGDVQVEERRPGQAGAGSPERLEPLLGTGDTEDFRERWRGIQTTFVDEPRQAVEQADGLVAELMQRLAQTFSEERESLESQWSQGEDVSTEDLRVGLQRYRSFFERLLST